MKNVTKNVLVADRTIIGLKPGTKVEIVQQGGDSERPRCQCGAATYKEASSECQRERETDREEGRLRSNTTCDNSQRSETAYKKRKVSVLTK
jgi:hypothetical protein